MVPSRRLSDDADAVVFPDPRRGREPHVRRGRGRRRGTCPRSRPASRCRTASRRRRLEPGWQAASPTGARRCRRARGRARSRPCAVGAAAPACSATHVAARRGGLRRRGSPSRSPSTATTAASRALAIATRGRVHAIRGSRRRFGARQRRGPTRGRRGRAAPPRCWARAARPGARPARRGRAAAAARRARRARRRTAGQPGRCSRTASASSGSSALEHVAAEQRAQLVAGQRRRHRIPISSSTSRSERSAYQVRLLTVPTGRSRALGDLAHRQALERARAGSSGGARALRRSSAVATCQPSIACSIARPHRLRPRAGLVQRRARAARRRGGGRR